MEDHPVSETWLFNQGKFPEGLALVPAGNPRFRNDISLRTSGIHTGTIHTEGIWSDSIQPDGISFDGHADCLVLGRNPLEGARRFTVEVSFIQYPGGLKEQRFLHVQTDACDDRVLLETRLSGAESWYADTFVKSGRNEAYLNDPRLLHACGRWHTMALVCNGHCMTQYVDSIPELSTALALTPSGPGKTSLGARLDRVSWFGGCLRLVRFTRDCVSPEFLLIGDGSRTKNSETVLHTPSTLHCPCGQAAHEPLLGKESDHKWRN